MSSELARILISIFMIVVALVAYKIGTKYISANKDGHPLDKIRHRLVWLKNGIILILASGIFFVWVSKFAGIVLSLAAVVGAMLIVNKELVMCIAGYFVLSISRPFKIGDYITVGTFSGRVIDIELFSTTLAQVGSAHQINGKSVYLPNNVFLTQAIENSSATSNYIINMYAVKLPINTDIDVVEQLALHAAETATSEWREEANAHFKRIEESDFVDMPSADPKILWESVDHREIKMNIRFACPVRKRVATEQEIFRLFWKAYREHLKQPPLV